MISSQASGELEFDFGADKKFGMLDDQKQRTDKAVEAANKEPAGKPASSGEQAFKLCRMSFLNVFHCDWNRNIYSRATPNDEPTFVFGIPFIMPWQSREALKKIMESMISKTGKLRSLIRDLEQKFDDAAATAYMPQMQIVTSRSLYLSNLDQFSNSGKIRSKEVPKSVQPNQLIAQVHHILEGAGAESWYRLWWMSTSMGKGWGWRLDIPRVSWFMDMWNGCHLSRSICWFLCYMFYHLWSFAWTSWGSMSEQKPRSNQLLTCPVLMLSHAITRSSTKHSSIMPFLGRPRCSAATGVEMKIRTDNGDNVECFSLFSLLIFLILTNVYGSQSIYPNKLRYSALANPKLLDHLIKYPMFVPIKCQSMHSQERQEVLQEAREWCGPQRWQCQRWGGRWSAWNQKAQERP